MSDNLQRYTHTVAALLGALGPRSRARVMLTLRALGLSEADARDEIERGLAERLFEADPADPETLRALPPS
ncbi:MAG: hypothetical protein QM820_58175 [Minicystis sp.]